MLAMPATGKIVQRVGCRVPIGFALLFACRFTAKPKLMDHAVNDGDHLILIWYSSRKSGRCTQYSGRSALRISLKSLMSGFHGMASLGGLAGVLTITALLALSISAVMSAFAVSLLLVIIVFLSVPYSIKAVENTESLSIFESEKVDTPAPATTFDYINWYCLLHHFHGGRRGDGLEWYLFNATIWS